MAFKVPLPKLRQFFFMADIVVSLIVMLGFFIIGSTKTFTPRASNVTRYCNDSSHSISPIPQLNYVDAEGAIMITFVILFSSISRTYSMDKLIKNLLWKIWILLMHLIFLFMFIELLKCAAGFPRPYFFSIESIRSYYCEDYSKEQTWPSHLEELDNDLRKSFPSCRSAIYGFCISFMIFYTDHFDTSFAINAIRHLIVLTSTSYFTYVQVWSLERGENHLSDVLVGCSIGVVQAMITVRSMFGSVLQLRMGTPSVIYYVSDNHSRLTSKHRIIIRRLHQTKSGTKMVQPSSC